MTPIHVFRVFIVSMSITLCLFRNDIYFHVPQITYKKKKISMSPKLYLMCARD